MSDLSGDGIVDDDVLSAHYGAQSWGICTILCVSCLVMLDVHVNDVRRL